MLLKRKRNSQQKNYLICVWCICLMQRTTGGGFRFFYVHFLKKCYMRLRELFSTFRIDLIVFFNTQIFFFFFSCIEKNPMAVLCYLKTEKRTKRSAKKLDKI